MQQQLSINADCTALNSTAEKDNERTTKNESGLQVYVHFAGSLFLFLIKKNSIYEHLENSNRRHAFQSQWKLVNVFSLKTAYIANLCRGFLFCKFKPVS